MLLKRSTEQTPHPSDAESVGRGTASDFGTFYERHVEAVTAYVARRAGAPDVTFDVVAATFARALEHRRRYDPKRGPAVAWLLGIARHLIVDGARRGRVAHTARVRLGRPRIELDDAAIARIEQRGAIDLGAALAGLPATQREAVLRRVVAEEPYGSIAACVGWSERVVRQRVSRALAALRGALEGGR